MHFVYSPCQSTVVYRDARVLQRKQMQSPMYADANSS